MSDSVGSRLNNMLTFIPQSHEKALKQAFYNIAAILFVGLASVAAVAVYYIMEPFFSPLLWAVLFGSVLHPIKQSLTDVVKAWFGDLQASGTPVCLGVVTFPIMIIDRISENLLYLFSQFWKIILFATVVISASICVLYVLPYKLMFTVLLFFKNVTIALASGLMSCLSIYLVLTIILAYIAVVVFFWTAESRPLLEKLALPVWLVLLLYLTAVAGPLREPLFCLLIVLVVVGCITNVKTKKEGNGSEDEQIESETGGMVIKIKQKFHDWMYPDEEPKECHIKDETETYDSMKSDENTENAENTERRKLNIKLKLSEQKLSNMYLYGLFLVCIVVQLWIHLTKILSVLIFIFAYILLKYVGYRLGFWSFMSNKPSNSESWLGERKDALLPGAVRGLWTLILKGDSKCMEYIDRAVDETISLIVIVLMFVFAICATVYLSVQIYTESAHLVDLTSNLINRTIVHNPELQEMLPAGLGEEIQTAMNSAMDNAYLYGRNYTVGAVRSMIHEEDTEKSKAIEEQVLDLIDNLYHAWMSRNNTVDEITGQTTPSENGTFDSLVEDLKKPGVLNLSFITEFAKENLGTLMSVMDSVWIVLKGNISLIINIFTAIFSVLLVGGTAVFNFFVNSVIFLTALVYLLCASGKQYKPVELAGKMMPSTGGTALGEAFNEAVNSVFAATFKRALFYGMYTWLIHTILAVQMVYIPAVLAAVLGAIPLTGTYLACFPAMIELWLVNGDVVGAVVMLILSFLPTYFIDTEINAEIKSGHPYLTALAITGGMFSLGIQGALIGPILLCLLSVVFKMYGSFMTETPDDERSPKRFPLKRTVTIN